MVMLVVVVAAAARVGADEDVKGTDSRRRDLAPTMFHPERYFLQEGQAEAGRSQSKRGVGAHLLGAEGDLPIVARCCEAASY